MSIFDVYQALPTAGILLVLWTAAGLAAMTLSAREAPLGILFAIALKSFAATLLMIAILSAASTFVLHRPFASPSLVLVLLAFWAGGWLMNRWLKQKGIARPFPGIGARAMLAAFVATIAGFALLLWYYAGSAHQS